MDDDTTYWLNDVETPACMSDFTSETMMSERSDRIDVAVWMIVPALLLASMPIGMMSGDGIAQASRYLAGSWTLNPNHLLYEPLGALWLKTISPLVPFRDPIDVLKLLSIACGGISLGLFRWLTDSVFLRRGQRNVATAAFGFSAGFLVHWISDETHMVQMPWLVLLAICLWRSGNGDGGRRWSLLAGVATSLSALWFISNVAVGAFAILGMAVFRWRRHGVFAAADTLISGGVAAAATLGLALSVGWSLSSAHSTVPLSSWIVSYAGGTGNPRVAGAYGIEANVRSILYASARATFGVASAVTDQSALASQLRSERNVLMRVLVDAAALLLMTIVVSLGVWKAWKADPRLQAFAWSMCGWSLGVVAFAILWNNSDAQFYFQLAIPFGFFAGWATSGAGFGRRALYIIPTALAWNVACITADAIRFPRQRMVDELRTVTADASLIVVPGHEVTEQLLYFLKLPRNKKLAITDIAEKFAPAAGLSSIDSVMSAAVEGGGHVIAIRVLHANPSVIPWRYIDKLGYPYLDIERQLVKGRRQRDVSTPSLSAFEISRQ